MLYNHTPYKRQPYILLTARSGMSQSKVTVDGERIELTVMYESHDETYMIVNNQSSGALFDIYTEGKFLGTITMSDMLEHVGYYSMS